MGLSKSEVPKRNKGFLEVLHEGNPKAPAVNSTFLTKIIFSKFFKSDGNAGEDIVEYALKNFEKWEQSIFKWQKEILEDK